ncbi:MAG: PKD domain-containing protein, partial [Fibrobacterota bacterium]|nr:PKD domain-containing protein [Fibrobacterota bacterium]
FMTLAEGPVSIEKGPDGSLYYISLLSGEVRRIGIFAGVPIAVASADSLSGSAPLKVSFSSAGSRDPRALALTYLWEFGDGGTSSAPNPSHTYLPNSTRTFSVKLTVANSHGKSAIDTLSITVGSSPPRASISMPAPGTMALAGDTIRYAATAVDDEETLPAEAFSWSVILHHDHHAHPFSATNGKAGYFVVEDHGQGDFFYDLLLSVTDRTGLRDTQRVEIGLVVPRNTPPIVKAEEDRIVAFDSTLTLKGSVSDDGLPANSGGLAVYWSCISWPQGGRVVFNDSTSLETRAEFSMPGEYVLRLAAHDGESESSSEFKVRVTPPIPTALVAAPQRRYGIGRFTLKEGERFRMVLSDLRGRPAYRAEGRGSLFPIHLAEALAHRKGRQVYLLRITAESLKTPAIILMSPQLQ